jgi:hypothetical protein
MADWTPELHVILLYYQALAMDLVSRNSNVNAHRAGGSDKMHSVSVDYTRIAAARAYAKAVYLPSGNAAFCENCIADILRHCTMTPSN